MYLIRTWHIFWHEYWGNITRRSYLIFTFGFPLFMVIVPIVGGMILALAIYSALPRTDPRPIGLIDQAQLLAAQEHPTQPVEVIFINDAQAAAEALDRGEIQAYYVIPADYWRSGQITITYDVPPTENIDAMVTRQIRDQVRANVPSPLLRRIEQGPHITHHGVTSQEETYSEADVIKPILVFLVIYFVRLAGSFTASYMFDSVASEAQDRTLEILVTTVTPLQFVTGKLLGLIAVGLTQIGMWVGAIVVFAIVVSYFLGINLLSFLLSWEHLALLVSVLLATYFLDQILAAAMGLLRVSGGAGNLLFNTINSVVGISLIYAAYFVPRNPNTPFAVAASLFPLTAPLVLLIRVVVTSVPIWQIVLSQLFLWGSCLLGLFWLRHLLKTNLVANTQPFKLRRWLRKNLGRLRSRAVMVLAKGGYG